jgi:hypothetical protein
MSSPEPTRERPRTVGRSALDVVLGLVGALFAVLIAAQTVATAQHHDRHAGILALAGLPALGAVLAAAGLVLGLRALRGGRRAPAAARALPVAGILLALAGLVLATWVRSQVGAS